MLEEKKQEEDIYRKWVFKANKIPTTTTDNLYDKITKENEERRAEVKRLSMALTKQNEKPFSFYEREKEKKAAAP